MSAITTYGWGGAGISTSGWGAAAEEIQNPAGLVPVIYISNEILPRLVDSRRLFLLPAITTYNIRPVVENTNEPIRPALVKSSELKPSLGRTDNELRPVIANADQALKPKITQTGDTTPKVSDTEAELKPSLETKPMTPEIIKTEEDE